jgi:hypothetical protein
MIAVSNRFERWSSWTSEAQQHKRNSGRRLSDLEAGRLGDTAYEDEEECTPSPTGSEITVILMRPSDTTPVGIELDMWACGGSKSAAEIVVGSVEPDTPADWHGFRVGDAIRSVNGMPCRTIENCVAAIRGHTKAMFTVIRRRVYTVHESALRVQRWTAEGEPLDEWTPVMLNINSARIVEMRPMGDHRGEPAQQVPVRHASHVSVEGMVLRLTAEDGHPLAALLAGSAADLERWHTLIQQLILAKPQVAIHLAGWMQRADAGPREAAQHWCELYSNGTVLCFASPHRNKLGQALHALSLSGASVRAEPGREGVFVVADERGGRWRCSGLRTDVLEQTPASVLEHYCSADGEDEAEAEADETYVPPEGAPPPPTGGE